MEAPAKKTIIKKMTRVFTWSIAVVMALFVFVQVAFWGGIVWINTQSGQEFLETVLGAQLKESGYRVEIGGFSYAFPTLLGVGKVTLYQEDNEIIEARSVHFDVDIFPLKKKILTLELNIGALTISQSEKPVTYGPVPEVSSSATPIVVAPFDLPEMPFDKFVIKKIAIDDLVIKGDQDIILSPKLTGEVVIKNERLIDVDLIYAERVKNAAEHMPRAATFKAEFNTKTAALKTQEMKVTAPLYAIEAHADAVFRADEYMNAAVSVRQKSIANLSPLKLTIKAKNVEKFSADIDITGQYFEKPVFLKTNLSMRGQSVVLKALDAKAPDISATGNITYNTAASIVTGKLSGRLTSLAAYQSFIGVGHDLGLTMFDIGLSGGKSGQQVKIDLESAGYKHKEYGLSLKNIKLDAGLSGQTFTVNSLTMRDKEQGTLKAKGVYNSATQNADFSINANKYRALKGEIANGMINADVTIAGNPEKYKIGGTIAPEKIDIKIPEQFSSGIPQLNVQKKGKSEINPPEAFGKNIALNLIIDAPRQIFVRGWGLDAEFGGKLEVKGTANDPKVYGDFEVVRGRYAEFGKKFKLARAKLKFSGSIPPSPTLDILAETTAGDILAKVGIAGNVMKPELEFSSEPALPQDEVMSHILFGEDLEEISPFQAVQLAQTMQRFTGVGGGGSSFDPMGDLRAVTGLDDLSVETDAAGGATVGAGKYLTEKVYLEFETGSEEGSSNANIEVELTPNITLESEIGQDASAGAGVFWKWDY